MNLNGNKTGDESELTGAQFAVVGRPEPQNSFGFFAAFNAAVRLPDAVEDLCTHHGLNLRLSPVPKYK